MERFVFKMTHIYNDNNVYKNRFKLEAQTHLLMTQTIMPVSWTSQGLQQQSAERQWLHALPLQLIRLKSNHYRSAQNFTSGYRRRSSFFDSSEIIDAHLCHKWQTFIYNFMATENRQKFVQKSKVQIMVIRWNGFVFM